MFYEKGVLKNFTKFTGKRLCQSPFFNKVAALSPATMLKKRLWHRFFPVNLVKFLRAPFLQNTSGRLLLNLGYFVLSGSYYAVFHKDAVIELALDKNYPLYIQFYYACHG